MQFLTENDKIRVGNIQARIRMILLYDLAMENNALVVGTGNKTELKLGYKELPRKPSMLASGMNWQNNLKNA